MKTAEYNYTEIKSGKFTVAIDKEKQYGYFEHETLGDTYGGGLWFKNNSLADYDGIADLLPLDVVKGIRNLGLHVNRDFY